MDLMTRRRALMARASEDAPIYEAKNILFNGSSFDTGVLAHKAGSAGYTLFMKLDGSNTGFSNTNFLSGFGFYNTYYYFYANNVYNMWGRKGIQPYHDVSAIPQEDGLKWIKTFVASFDFETMKEIVAFNTDVRTGNMTEAYVSTEPLVINPDKKNNGMIVEEVRVYDYPMSVEDVRKLTSRFN